MKKDTQVAEEFMAELRGLLNKWDAEISAEDHFKGYPECGEDVRITITIPSKYDENGEYTREWTEIDIGNLYRAYKFNDGFKVI